MIPEYTHRYFWDIDPMSLDPARDQHFIIERILEKGDENSVRWLKEQYSEQMLQETVTTSRRLSPKSRRYWELTLHLWSTLNQSASKPGKIWQH